MNKSIDNTRLDDEIAQGIVLTTLLEDESRMDLQNNNNNEPDTNFASELKLDEEPIPDIVDNYGNVILSSTTKEPTLNDSTNGQIIHVFMEIGQCMKSNDSCFHDVIIEHGADKRHAGSLRAERIVQLFKESGNMSKLPEHFNKYIGLQVKMY
jgi:hypothetical protein